MKDVAVKNHKFISAMVALLFGIVLTSCGDLVQSAQDAGPEKAEAESVSSDLRPVESLKEIEGPWDVVSFDGYEPKRIMETVRATAVDFGEGGVALRLECNYSSHAGRVEKGRFISRQEGSGPQTAMGCHPPEIADRERRFFAFFGRGPTVNRISRDRLALRSANVELIVERPGARRLAFRPASTQLQGKWRLTGLTRYLPDGGYAGGGLGEVPGRIEFVGDHVRYTPCPQYEVRYRYGEDARLRKVAGAALPDSPSGCSELVEEPSFADAPTLWDILRILHSNPAVEVTGEDTLLFTTEEFGLSITKKPCETLWQSDDHSRTEIRDCGTPE